MGGDGANSTPPSDTPPGGGDPAYYPQNQFLQTVGGGLSSFGSSGYQPYQASPIQSQGLSYPPPPTNPGLIPVTQNSSNASLEALLQLLMQGKGM